MKLLSTFSLLILFSNFSFCQKNSFGVIAGGTYSRQIFDHNLEIDEHHNYIPGFIIGLNGTHYLNNTFAIRGELLIEQKGGEYCSNQSYVIGNGFGPASYRSLGGTIAGERKHCVEDKYTYITLPLLLQFSRGVNTKFQFHIGQSIGYQLNREDNYSYELTNEISKWNYSLLAGIGLEFWANEKSAFQIQTRVTHSVNNIGKEENMSLKHLNFSGTIGCSHIIN